MRAPVTLTVAGVMMCVLTGCFAPGDPVVQPTSPAQPISQHPLHPITTPEVLAYCPTSEAEHLSGFAATPDAVYICRAGEHRATDGVSTYGPWETVYQLEEPRPLLALFVTPNQTRDDDPCPDLPTDPLVLWVRASGTTTPVYAPVDGCGQPQQRIADAYVEAKLDLIVEVDTGFPLDPNDTPAEHG
jgi:hypothetical protein